MEPKLEDKPIVQKAKKTWDQKKARDEEQERRRKRKEQADLKAEVAGCLSVAGFELNEEVVVEYDSETPVWPMRTRPRTPGAPNSSIDVEQTPTSEITNLKAEIVQLRKDLDSTKARVRELVDQREEALEQQQAAALRDARDEVAAQKRIVEEVKNLLEDAKQEKRRLWNQLQVSEDKVDELENQVRNLKKTQTQDEYNLPPSDERVESRHPQTASPQKARQLSASKKSREMTFLVKSKPDADKVIIRAKRGNVPLALS